MLSKEIIKYQCRAVPLRNHMSLYKVAKIQIIILQMEPQFGIA